MPTVLVLATFADAVPTRPTLELLTLARRIGDPVAVVLEAVDEAAAVTKAGADLVVCGMSSTDGAMGVLPAMLGERLGWPTATYAGHLSVADGHATIMREDDTARLTVEVDLPAVVSVTDQSGEARYPSMRGILAAKKKPVQTWDLDDLGLDPADVGLDAAWTRVVGAEPRPARGAGQVVTDSGGSGAAAVLEFLHAGRYA